MASSMIDRVVGVTRTSIASSSSSQVARLAAAEPRRAGFVAMLWSLEGRCSTRRQSPSLSSSYYFSHYCKLLFPVPCTASGPQRSRQSAVRMVLPTGTSVKEGEGTGPRGHQEWSARAIKAFSMAELEARKLKYPTTGTEAILMGILTEGTSFASKFLRANGVTLFAVRDETIKILGKADMYFFSPEHPALTEQAQKALDWAIAEKTKRGGGKEVTASYMLVGIWAQKGSAGQKVLDALGFDDEKAEKLLATDKEVVGVS